MRVNKDDFLNGLIVVLLIGYKYILMWSRTNNIYTNVMIIGIAIFSVIMLLKKKMYKSDIKSIVIILIFFLLAFYKSRTIDIVVSLLIALLYVNSEKAEEKFLKVFTYSSCIFYISTIALYMLGILSNNASQRVIAGEVVGRNSLGFVHVNATFLYFVPIVLGFLYIGRKKSTGKQFFCLAVMDILSIILYYYTLCRTGFILIIILNIIFLFRNQLQKMKICNFIFQHSYIFLLGFMLVLCFMCGNDYTDPINKALSFRPSFGLEALRTYPIRPFGFGVNEDLILDCAYLRILLSFGAIPYILYYYFHARTYRYFKEDNYLLIAVLVLSIYQLFENNYLYYTNFLMTLQFIYFIRKNRIGSKKNEE